MDALALLYFAKIYWLYVRMIGVCGYGYIHGYQVINLTSRKSVDMDMDDKFHIHGKPGYQPNRLCY